MPIADVLKFSADYRIKMSRATSSASTQYRKKAGKLSEVGRRRLRHLEDELFAEGRSAASCVRDMLLWPEGAFKSPYGWICFFFNPETRRFVLSDFGLRPGGTGGKPSPARHRADTLILSTGTPVLVDSIAARYAEAAYAPDDAIRAEIAATFAVWDAAGILELEHRIDRAWEALVIALADFTFAPRYLPRLHVPFEDHRHPLPFGLSYLQMSGQVGVSITVGALICRLGAAMPWPVRRAADAPPAGGRDDIGCLLDASFTLFGAQAGTFNVDTDNDALNSLVTSRLITEHLFDDDCRLALVRGEVMLRLARAVEVFAVAGAPAGAMARRYARLGEVALLSGSYFGTGYLTAQDVLASLDGDDHRLLDAAPTLLQFCRSTAALAQIIDNVHPDISTNGMDAMRHRLRDLIEEILKPA